MNKKHLIQLFCGSIMISLLLSCSRPLAIPSHVDRIDVIDQQDPARREDISHVSIAITDSEKIGSVIDFLDQHNSFWYGEITTFPSSRFTAVFYDKGEVKLVLWIGYEWIGGRNGGEERKDNRQRS